MVTNCISHTGHAYILDASYNLGFHSQGERVSFRIAVMHYADVSNYGDALFPHLVRWQLGQRIPKSTFDFFGPTHDRCGALNSRRFHRNLPSSSYQAAIMAGGEVIHLGDEGLLGIYECFGQQSIAKPTDIVFGWSQWRLSLIHI